MFRKCISHSSNTTSVYFLNKIDPLSYWFSFSKHSMFKLLYSPGGHTPFLCQLHPCKIHHFDHSQFDIAITFEPMKQLQNTLTFRTYSVSAFLLSRLRLENVLKNLEEQKVFICGSVPSLLLVRMYIRTKYMI